MGLFTAGKYWEHLQRPFSDRCLGNELESNHLCLGIFSAAIEDAENLRRQVLCSGLFIGFRDEIFGKNVTLQSH